MELICSWKDFSNVSYSRKWLDRGLLVILYLRVQFFSCTAHLSVTIECNYMFSSWLFRSVSVGRVHFSRSHFAMTVLDRPILQQILLHFFKFFSDFLEHMFPFNKHACLAPSERHTIKQLVVGLRHHIDKYHKQLETNGSVGSEPTCDKNQSVSTSKQRSIVSYMLFKSSDSVTSYTFSHQEWNEIAYVVFHSKLLIMERVKRSIELFEKKVLNLLHITNMNTNTASYKVIAVASRCETVQECCSRVLNRTCQNYRSKDRKSTKRDRFTERRLRFRRGILRSFWGKRPY